MKNILTNIKILKDWGQELFDRPQENVKLFSENDEINNFLTDLNNNPHAFLIGCIMDRGIRTERAWEIPYKVSKIFGGFDISKLLVINEIKFQEIFEKEKLHRWNKKMAKNFYLAIQKIHNDYNNDASNIWNNKPSSASVVRKFIQFNGVSSKIGTMAANILARDFKIPMKDYYCIDISVDRQVRKVFKRLGLVDIDAKDLEIIYMAREFNLIYPGIFDLPCWNIGREWCYDKNPKCQECRMNEACPKLFIEK